MSLETRWSSRVQLPKHMLYRNFLLHGLDKRDVANVAKAVGESNIGDAVSAAVDIPYSRRSAAVIWMCWNTIIA